MTLVLFCFVQPRRVVVEYKAVVEVVAVEEVAASVVSLVFCFFLLFSFGTCCAGCRRCRRDEDTVEEDRDDEDWSAAATVKLYATTTSNTVMNMGTNNRFVIISIITITLWLRFYSVGFWAVCAIVVVLVTVVLVVFCFCFIASSSSSSSSSINYFLNSSWVIFE